MTRGVVSGVALWLLLLALSGCSQPRDDTVLVMAAASLTEAFTEIEAAFEIANPDIDVQLNLAGSAALREQILQGAPADVFASASPATMRAVVDAGAATSTAPFATNALALAVPVGNPAGISSIEDLANDDLYVGLCAVGVPCGDFARQALAQVGVDVALDTNERNVRALVTRIAADELDVGIVYATDVAANAALEAIALPPEAAVDVIYPITQLVDAPNREGAAAFVDFVRSPAGQAIVTSHGFGPVERRG